MKEKINVHGNLEIERKGKWKLQECMHDGEYWCGDHCPAFVEIGDEESTDCIHICTGAVHEIVEDLR